MFLLSRGGVHWHGGSIGMGGGGGSGWRLAVGRRWRLAPVGGWRLVAVGGWWELAAGGPLGRSLRAVLNKKKKKSGSLRTALTMPPDNVTCSELKMSTQHAMHAAGQEDAKTATSCWPMLSAPKAKPQSSNRICRSILGQNERQLGRGCKASVVCYGSEACAMANLGGQSALHILKVTGVCAVYPP